MRGTASPYSPCRHLCVHDTYIHTYIYHTQLKRRIAGNTEKGSCYNVHRYILKGKKEVWNDLCKIIPEAIDIHHPEPVSFFQLSGMRHTYKFK